MAATRDLSTGRPLPSLAPGHSFPVPSILCPKGTRSVLSTAMKFSHSRDVALKHVSSLCSRLWKES